LRKGLPERGKEPSRFIVLEEKLTERGKEPSIFIMMEEKLTARGKESRGLYCWRRGYQREERNPRGS
jgi:hypothetical protein